MDLLTLREREVLALLQKGLTNEQIADQLGISLNGAKYHVSNIIGKLGVENRREAARWQPEESRKSWFSVLLGGPRSWPLSLKALTALAASTALIVLGITLVRDPSPALPPGSSEPQESADSNPESIQITWNAASAPLFEGEEQSEPFVDFYPEIPASSKVWRLMVGSVGQEPRQLHETKRWITLPVWNAEHGLSIRFSSKAAFAPNGSNFVNGLLFFDTSDQLSAAGHEILLQSTSFAGYWPSPDGGRILALAQASPLMPPRDSEPSSFMMLIDSFSKRAQILSGLPGRVSASNEPWSSSGNFILVSASDMPFSGLPTAVPIYVSPTRDGEAYLLTRTVLLEAQWSPNGTDKLAFVDDSRSLWLWDSATKTKEKLASVQGELSSLLRWLSDDMIQYQNKVYDLRTGGITVHELSLSSGTSGTLTISADGRYALAADSPSINQAEPEPCPQTNPSQNRVFLSDSSTGEVGVIKDCDGRDFIHFGWLSDSRHVVLSGGACTACESPMWRLILMDIFTLEEVQLTNEFEFAAHAVISPDKSMVLVTGDSLRLYSMLGELIQTIDAPDGSSVTSAAWSEDGKSFTYVLGPTGFWGI